MTPKIWSVKKRVGVAVLVALIILGGALMIGSLWYVVGRGLGIFKPFNILGIVSEQVKADPKLVAEFYQTLDETRCVNSNQGFSLAVEKPFTITPTTEQNKCMEMTLIGSKGNMAYIKIQKKIEVMANVIATDLQGLREVTTDAFNHPQYQATIIRGTKEQIPVMMIVFNTNEKVTWNMVYYPAEAEGEKMVERLALSFKLLGE